ncbi:2-oxoglutarate and iron-dependent oxygenase domain-containing protein 2-like isoform X4 [Dendronephthya gigantea]|uniref:2-oxoglutarate and iron-dependent oxygenase domain-containing protein 2-like isoform X4 n=1 Tax=Dendronephthya gigantea TaxID=151771 RepID=UPI00106978DB|nr:2-oxoglutarate and iron-dependent oxygenase domain-containing protein 2-like isoform X4 [Dendronephthya gigantea]
MQGYICRCFYERNIYLKSLGLHVTYAGDEADFRSKYAEYFSNIGCTEEDIGNIIVEVQNEMQRRRDLHDKSEERKSIVCSQYKRLHPECFVLKESYFDPQFLRIVKYAKSEKSSFRGLLSVPFVKANNEHQLYVFPVFTEEFCRNFMEELDHFNESKLPKGRPNTMNNYGILLDELGFDENFLDVLLHQYIKPLSGLMFPKNGGRSLDSYKAFTVKYKMGDDLSLGYHYDNAEVTLNVCMGKNFTEGNLYFGDMKEVPVFQSECIEMEHRQGYGILHRGGQMHGALPIHSGERHNVVVWMRSSEIRNKCCPMCVRKPNLVKVAGKGDGFTLSSMAVCSTQ